MAIWANNRCGNCGGQLAIEDDGYKCIVCEREYDELLRPMRMTPGELYVRVGIRLTRGEKLKYELLRRRQQFIGD